LQTLITAGGLWNGQATLVIAEDSGIAHRFERLRWDWLGARVMAGELALRIEIEDPKLHGGARVALCVEGLRASGAAFQLAALGTRGLHAAALPRRH
jgi:hypothetical protein